MKRFVSLWAAAESIQRYPFERQLDNLDERLIEIDIAGHGYTEKAVKKCGLRYLGPSFYQNWRNADLHENGTCADPEVTYAKENQHHNPTYWILNAIPIIKQTIGGSRMYNFWNGVEKSIINGFNTCSDEMVEATGVMLPYCHMHQGLKLYDLRGYGPRYLPESSKQCVEAYMYHVGPERMHGVFFDTASTRSMLSTGINYGPNKEEEDLAALTEVVEFTRNIWRDYVLDDEAIVIANSGNKGSSGQLMKSKIDSVTMKEHYIESYPNFYTGVCPDADPKYEFDLRCVNYSLDDWNKGIRKWREELVNLIKYGPLDGQAQFVQGWNHPDTPQLMLDNFGEDMVTRFTRYALESHVGVVSFSHGGNGDPLAVNHGSDFYKDLFARPEYQKCTGNWGTWGEWSNCDRSCYDGIRIRERQCDGGDNGLCDGSERDMQVCNQDPCYDWPVKGWTHWGEWSSCSASCNGGQRERRRTCKDADNICDGSRDVELENCNDHSCPVNKCPLELEAHWPASFKNEEFFPYFAYFHRTEDNEVSERPRYIKYAKNIELVYENNAWIVRDNDKNRVVLVSYTDAFCPEFIAASDWHYLDLATNDLKNDATISFSNAKSGDDYSQGSTSYSATTLPGWTEWGEWSNCDGTCGSNAVRTRTRSCGGRLCPGDGTQQDNCGFADCTEDEKKLPCVSDDNGLRWRPVYKQWRSNGGIPIEHEDDILSNSGFTYNANPPKDGLDYVNFANYENMAVNGEWHMKMIWSKGESITWKQQESMFAGGSKKVKSVTDVVGQNHKGQSELVFHGLSKTGENDLRYNSLWDGLHDMSLETHMSYYHEVMDFCYQSTKDWAGYNVLIFDDGRQWDQQQYYGTFMTKTENQTPPQSNFDPLLGEGEAVQGDDVNCMDTSQFWEYSDRGHNNNYVSIYVVDSTCPEPSESFPQFVRCYGPQANPSEDGSSCDCGDNASHNTQTGMCECDSGYVQTKYQFYRMPECVKCSGPGSHLGFYGCQCGENMVLNEAEGTCECADGLVFDEGQTYCYDGIDVQFDGEYDCSKTAAEDFAALTLDLDIAWGSTGNEYINCDRFGQPVIEIRTQPGELGGSSGTEFTMRPDSVKNNQLQAATFMFEVYVNEDFVFPQAWSLPGYFFKSDGSAQPIRLQANQNGEVFMNENSCNICPDINAGGNLGTLSVGEWTKIELRVKLNDENQANGEFIAIWNDVEVVRRNDLANMMPGTENNLEGLRLWTMINWPEATNESNIFYRQVVVKKFISDGEPHTTTAPVVTTPPITTTPSKYTLDVNYSKFRAAHINSLLYI